MTKPNSIWIASVLTIAALPVLFLFQNCAQPTKFKMDEASINVTSTSDICQSMNEIVGDMRVVIIPGYLLGLSNLVPLKIITGVVPPDKLTIVELEQENRQVRFGPLASDVAGAGEGA